MHEALEWWPDPGRTSTSFCSPSVGPDLVSNTRLAKEQLLYLLVSWGAFLRWVYTPRANQHVYYMPANVIVN